MGYLVRLASMIGAAALFAGCGGSQGPLGAPGPMPQSVIAPHAEHSHSAYSVIYSFTGGPDDGAKPEAGLLNVNGTLYGTTEDGGAYSYGTIFELDTSGNEHVLYSFRYGNDGCFPVAPLTAVDGTLYSPTGSCGSYYDGTIFNVNAPREEQPFQFNDSDGESPQAGLLGVNGKLYGTTAFGGRYADGTVFALTTSGKETVLHSFGEGGTLDGEHPRAGLVNVNGTLYGTTEDGGAYNHGMVFAITTSGNETALYSFGDGGSLDGEYPKAGLVNVNGTLYGTTMEGGAHHRGIVFAITASGNETVRYNFGDHPHDGADPYAGLIYVNGTLYGTTYYGGLNGHGTVFAVTTSGEETVLHSFHGGHDGDGANPIAGLININDTLYGTTYYGGGAGGGYGAIFSLTL